MKVIQKDWGTQIWLNDYELLMVMKAGGETSMHCHRCHTSEIVALSGEASVVIPSDSTYDIGSRHWSVEIDYNEVHQIVAVTDCVLRERYTPTGTMPEQDIERL